MKGSELKIKLRKAGCYKVREDTNHEKWFSPITKKYFWVPRHNSQEIAKGTLNKILKDAGLK